MAIDPKQLKKALVSKGFLVQEGKRHTRFILRHTTPGKNQIFTVLSRGGHGKDDMGPGLESVIRKELGFEIVQQLRMYAKCDLSEEEYVRILKRRGLLNRKGQARPPRLTRC